MPFLSQQQRMEATAEQQHKRQKISREEMLQRYVSHIPARHFKTVRYYGFLANRKQDTLLPKVYDVWR
ncbi:transposase [Serratia nevei]|uniref:transposase n=1 Tax=Serratia nevei TaxID=2703794 RepID=UPI000A83E99D|nr:transposase [Serratia marcescens]